jgi:hypothetical protein
VGDIARFPDRNHFASWTGTAPIDASSGEHTRHRLSRAGNRRLNHVLYMAGIVQLRNDTPGRAYYRRKMQQSKTSMEAMRCLRRRLSDVVYRQLTADAATRAPVTEKAGPGGQSGTTLKSSAAGLTPDIGSSDQPLPGPAPSTLPPPVPARNPAGPGTGAIPRRRAGGVNVAPHRTNDVDAGKRRRTLESLPHPHPLTKFFIEGSHARAVLVAGRHEYLCRPSGRYRARTELRGRRFGSARSRYSAWGVRWSAIKPVIVRIRVFGVMCRSSRGSACPFSWQRR